MRRHRFHWARGAALLCALAVLLSSCASNDDSADPYSEVVDLEADSSSADWFFLEQVLLPALQETCVYCDKVSAGIQRAYAAGIAFFETRTDEAADNADAVCRAEREALTALEPPALTLSETQRAHVRALGLDPAGMDAFFVLPAQESQQLDMTLSGVESSLTARFTIDLKPESEQAQLYSLYLSCFQDDFALLQLDAVNTMLFLNELLLPVVDSIDRWTADLADALETENARSFVWESEDSVIMAHSDVNVKAAQEYIDRIDESLAEIKRLIV